MASLAHDGGVATTVVVADDEEDARWLVATALRADGFEVLEAADGVALLALLDDVTLNVDVVVTDIQMPRLSGLGVLHALRKGRRSVPVIVMTGLSDASIRAEALELGAVDVMRKPFQPNDLLAAVRKAGARVHRSH